eukprot:m.7796 g.7796  ORF g.7796 m.7796 type:complete len:396 (+) comp2921_c0_seq2:41-1228(+)
MDGEGEVGLPKTRQRSQRATNANHIINRKSTSLSNSSVNSASRSATSSPSGKKSRRRKYKKVVQNGRVLDGRSFRIPLSVLIEAKSRAVREEMNLTSDKYFVETVLKTKRGPSNSTLYFVKWLGFGQYASTWEKEDTLPSSFTELVKTAAKHQRIYCKPPYTLRRLIPIPFENTHHPTVFLTPSTQLPQCTEADVQYALNRGVSDDELYCAHNRWSGPNGELNKKYAKDGLWTFKDRKERRPSQSLVKSHDPSSSSSSYNNNKHKKLSSGTTKRAKRSSNTSSLSSTYYSSTSTPSMKRQVEAKGNLPGYVMDNEAIQMQTGSSHLLLLCDAMKVPQDHKGVGRGVLHMCGNPNCFNAETYLGEFVHCGETKVNVDDVEQNSDVVFCSFPCSQNQ